MKPPLEVGADGSSVAVGDCCRDDDPPAAAAAGTEE